MVPFFRKIRKQLADDNQFLKYSRYAVGEIVLVVVGILIALQINTWNGHRLERQEEIRILKSVRNDLENTIKEFEFLNQIRDLVLNSTKEIYTMANSGDFEGHTLDSLIGLTLYRPTFNNKLGAIELLFSSGKINMITNDSIREFLIAWPGSIDDMIEEEVYAVSVFQNNYYPVVARYLIIQNILDLSFSSSMIGPVVREEIYPAPPIESDYDGLLKDKGFLNHLRMRATHFQITKTESNHLIDSAREIIEKINREIDA